MLFLYVLSYGTSSVYEIILNEEVDIDEKSTEEILEECGLNMDECSYMWSNDKLELKTLTHIVK